MARAWQKVAIQNSGTDQVFPRLVLPGDAAIDSPARHMPGRPDTADLVAAEGDKYPIAFRATFPIVASLALWALIFGLLGQSRILG